MCLLSLCSQSPCCLVASGQRVARSVCGFGWTVVQLMPLNKNNLELPLLSLITSYSRPCTSQKITQASGSEQASIQGGGDCSTLSKSTSKKYNHSYVKDGGKMDYRVFCYKTSVMNFQKYLCYERRQFRRLECREPNN